MVRKGPIEDKPGHIHNERDCYTTTLTCNIPLHMHDRSCGGRSGQVTCGMALHTHNANNCYSTRLTCSK